MDETRGLKHPEILDIAEVMYLKEDTSNLQYKYTSIIPFPNRLPKHWQQSIYSSQDTEELLWEN